MTILRFAAMGLVMLGLAACDTPTTVPAPAPAPATATGGTVEAVVAAAQADIGKDIGGGITLTGVSADDETLSFAFQYVATVTQLDAIGRQAFEDGFTDTFVGSLCANPPVQAFVSRGGAIAVRMVDPNGAPILNRRVTAC